LGAAVGRQRVLLLCLAVAALAGGVYFVWRGQTMVQASAVGVAPIKVIVEPINYRIVTRNQQQTNAFDLVLKEEGGSRNIRMSANSTEALVIGKETGIKRDGQTIQTDPSQVAHAYDLTSNVVSQLGGRVERVLVYDADQTNFYANIVINTGTDTRVLNAGPVEATALAVRTGAPIFVEEAVFSRAR
jgi:bifunctional DNase/RNase